MPTFHVRYREGHPRGAETVEADEVDERGGQLTFWRYQLVVGRPRVVTALRVRRDDVAAYEQLSS